MKVIFELYLILSLLILAQQNVIAKVQIESPADSALHEELEHSHAFLFTLEAIILGSVEHEHEDDGRPWSNAHTHDNRAHHHHESPYLKIELATSRSFVSFLDSTNLVFFKSTF